MKQARSPGPTVTVETGPEADSRKPAQSWTGTPVMTSSGGPHTTTPSSSGGGGWVTAATRPAKSPCTIATRAPESTS